MFKLFTRKQPAAYAPAPRVHVVEPKPQPFDVKQLTGGVLRAGMWVRLGDRTGILKEMNGFAVATVAIVDEDGFTVLEVSVPAGELRQAKRTEIPAKRVAHLTSEELNRRGYAE